MTADEISSFAEAFLDGTWAAEAQQACMMDRALTARVSTEVAALIRERAIAAGSSRTADDSVWFRAQRGVYALARLQGADRVALAGSFLQVVVTERVYGVPSGLSQEMLRFLLVTAGDYVETLATLEPGPFGHTMGPPWPTGWHVEPRFLLEALWALPGPEGARWMLRLLRADPEGSGYGRPERTADDIIARLDALSDARLNPSPTWLYVFALGCDEPPRATSAAQTRLLCTYARDLTMPPAQVAVGRLRAFRTGRPTDDVDLFWWGATDQEALTLRAILEVTGAPGTREPLVAAAKDAGLIGPDVAAVLSEPMMRPEWADGPIPYRIETIQELGRLALRSGRVGGADGSSTSELSLSWSIGTTSADCLVRSVIASHPLELRDNAAIELIFRPDEPVEQWHHMPDKDGLAGFQVEYGAGAIGAVEALEAAGRQRALNESLGYDPAGALLETVGENGSFVVFSVGPQNQTCVSWVGVTAAGEVARIVTDLGLLNLDPTVRPLPWS